MLCKQNIVYVIQELRKRCVNETIVCAKFHGPHVFSLDAVHSFNFDKKINAALRHSCKRLDIEDQCLQIRTHISHKITKQVNALQSLRAKSFDLGDITNVTKFG